MRFVKMSDFMEIPLDCFVDCIYNHVDKIHKREGLANEKKA